MDTSGRVLIIKISFILVITSLFLGARAAKNLSILFKTSCDEFQEHLNNPLSASLTVANKSDERCTWNMRKLLHLQKQAIVYKTNSMDCVGGQVTFETDYRNKSVTENFCNQSKCLVFMRKESEKICDSSVLNETVPQIFGDCHQYVSHVKPSTMKIVAEKSVRSFQLEYQLFNCRDEDIESHHTARESTTAGGHAMNTTQNQANESFTEARESTTAGGHAMNTTRNQADESSTEGTFTTIAIHTTLPNAKEKDVKKIPLASSSWPPEAWKYLLPIILLTLLAIIVCIAYWFYSKSKSPSRRKEGRDEHISTIAL